MSSTVTWPTFYRLVLPAMREQMNRVRRGAELVNFVVVRAMSVPI